MTEVRGQMTEGFEFGMWNAERKKEERGQIWDLEFRIADCLVFTPQPGTRNPKIQ